MSANKVWEKFIQPLKDLADLWSLDIEKDLTAYLGELHKATVAFNGQNVNFAEAAVLVQNSAQYYSKKVELLAVLVYTVLERISESKRRELQGDGSSNVDGEVQELSIFEGDALKELLKIIQAGQPHLLHDFLQTNDGFSRRPTRHALATCDCIPFEDFEKTEKNYRMRVAELSDRCCLLVNADSAFLVSNQPSISSMLSLDVSRIPAMNQMHSLDSSQGLREVQRELDDLLAYKEEARSVGSSCGDNDIGPDDGADVMMPSFTDDGDSNVGQPVADPILQSLGDPYDVSQNVVQPFTKGTHERKVKQDAIPHLNLEFLDGTPDDAFECGFLLTAQVLRNESIKGRKPLYMSSLQDMRKEELKRRRLELREKNERGREEEQRLRALIPGDVDPVVNLAHIDDDLDAEDNVFDDFADPVVMETSVAGLCSPTQEEKWVQEAVQQMSQYQKLSEEEVAVHERVSKWTKRIEPILNMQEQEEHEKPFKLYHYADCIMQHFKTKQVVNFADVVVPDQFIDDQKIHIARTFLACLQLANNGNLDLQHKPGIVNDSEPLHLKFIRIQGPQAFEDSSSPITDSTNVPRPADHQPADERPAKRKKAVA